MRKCCSLFFLTFLVQFTADSQVLISNTNVVDVENRKILSGYDVVVLDGRIVSVDKDKKFKLPPGTIVLDGTGKWLIPGFTDAHVHFFQSGILFARPDAIDLRKFRPYADEIRWTKENMKNLLQRYAASGITSVIDVGATFSMLEKRDSLASDNSLPFVNMTGPLLTTWIPEQYKNLGNDQPFQLITNKTDAENAVRDQVRHRAGFIKIWYIVLDKDKEAGARKNYGAVKAAVDEAHRSNLRVAVHATERITAQLAVEAGADFLVHSIEDEIVTDAFASILKEKNVVLCPTLVVENGYLRTFSDNVVLNTYELDHAHPFAIGSIIDYPWPDTITGKQYIGSLRKAGRIGEPNATDTIREANLRKLLNAGVYIATGTDAGNIGTQHVTSYFEELAAMKNAGMDNWQLLQASTINGARASGMEKEMGSIAKNKWGNMVLLNANPLEQTENWKKIDRVIMRGQVFHPDTIVVNTPEMLAQQQLNAYNAHDLEAFLSPYADDVEIYSTNGKLQMKGKEEMRKQYTFITKMPHLYCRLINRIVSGNTVIDHEEIWTSEKPVNLRYGAAIYVIEKGKISRVYFAD